MKINSCVYVNFDAVFSIAVGVVNMRSKIEKSENRLPYLKMYSGILSFTCEFKIFLSISLLHRCRIVFNTFKGLMVGRMGEFRNMVKISSKRIKMLKQTQQQARSTGVIRGQFSSKFFLCAPNFVVPRKSYFKHTIKQKSFPPKNVFCPSKP